MGVRVTTKKSFSKEWLNRVLLVVIGFGFALLLLELMARLLPPPYPSDEPATSFVTQSTGVLTCDSTLGWVGRSNFEGILKRSDDHQVNLKLNNAGMHDTDHAFQKPDGVFRMLVLGDSFVHAIQVDEADTAHQVLEDWLNQRVQGSETVEVISSGVTGWGTGQELIYYREQGRRFEPDLVLLMLFLGNDFENNLPGNVLTIQDFNCYAPYFAVCDGQITEPLLYAPGLSELESSCTGYQRFLNNALGKLYQHSRLYQQLEPLIIAHHPRQMFGEAYPGPFWALYLPTDEVELEQAWQITEVTIKQLQQEVEADGAKLVTVFFPWGIIVELSTLSPPEQQSLLVENPAYANLDLNRPHQHLAKFLTHQQIPFIDLTESMIAHQKQNSTALYFFGDSHWTAAGNRFVAETLAQWLTAHEMAPVE